MRVEHFALNVEDAAAMTQWYCEHLGMRIVRQAGKAFFLADETGHGIIEIYRNPPEAVPDYAAMDPLILHLAFYSDDLAGDYARLVAAGATGVDDPPAPGNVFGVCMLRDPWGLAIQLARRDTPFLA